MRLEMGNFVSTHTIEQCSSKVVLPAIHDEKDSLRRHVILPPRSGHLPALLNLVLESVVLDA